MLEKFRRGQCDEESVKLLQGCGTALQVAGAIKVCSTPLISRARVVRSTADPLRRSQPTNLYPLRDAVARENAQEYKKLRDKAYTFEADDAYRGVRGKDAMKTRVSSSPPVRWRTLLADSPLRHQLKDCPPDEKLNLKKGAQVLLLANLDVKCEPFSLPSLRFDSSSPVFRAHSQPASSMEVEASSSTGSSREKSPSSTSLSPEFAPLPSRQGIAVEEASAARSGARPRPTISSRSSLRPTSPWCFSLAERLVSTELFSLRLCLFPSILREKVLTLLNY